MESGKRMKRVILIFTVSQKIVVEIVMIAFIILSVADIHLALTVGQTCLGFTWMTHPTDFFVSWTVLLFTRRKLRL